MDTFSQQDELEKLKEWWKNYGNALMLGVAIGLAVLFGGKYWTEHKERQYATASVLYDELQQAYRGNAAERARQLVDQLKRDYESTPYAGMAALLAARAAHENGDAPGARLHLEWALANASHDPARRVARLRLARLRLASGDLDGALALADGKPVDGFETEYLELRGDIYVAQGKVDAARSAYRDALERAGELGAYRAVLRMKLDNLGAVPAS